MEVFKDEDEAVSMNSSNASGLRSRQNVLCLSLLLIFVLGVVLVSLVNNADKF